MPLFGSNNYCSACKKTPTILINPSFARLLSFAQKQEHICSHPSKYDALKPSQVISYPGIMHTAEKTQPPHIPSKMKKKIHFPGGQCESIQYLWTTNQCPTLHSASPLLTPIKAL